jgi:hypothetical protein
MIANRVGNGPQPARAAVVQSVSYLLYPTLVERLDTICVCIFYGLAFIALRAGAVRPRTSPKKILFAESKKITKSRHSLANRNGVKANDGRRLNRF